MSTVGKRVNDQPSKGYDPTRTKNIARRFTHEAQEPLTPRVIT